MNTIAISKTINGDFDISFENGSFVEELSEESFAKHILLCFGRLNENATVNPLIRNGDLASYFEDEELFSIAWAFYIENNIRFENINQIIEQFNKSCDRDFNKGLFSQKIKMTNISKIDKNTVSFKITIGDTDKAITINI